MLQVTLIICEITNLSSLNPENDSCVDVSMTLDVCNLTYLSSPTNPNNDSLQSLIVNACKLELKFTKP